VVEEAATEVIAREQMRGHQELWQRPDFIEAIVRLQKHRQLEAAMASGELYSSTSMKKPTSLWATT
jgi:predicted ATPase